MRKSSNSQRARNANRILHTKGQSKQRDQERADFRARVLRAFDSRGLTRATVSTLAYTLRSGMDGREPLFNVTPQRIVCALKQLERQGEVFRASQGEYARTGHSES